MVKNQRTRIRRINRTRDRVMDQERLERKITELTNWFRNPVPPLPQVESNQDSHRNQIQRAGSRTKGRAKQGRTDTGNVGEKNTTESVMFVPATPRSDLMRSLQSADRSFCKLYGRRPIKFAERTGRKLTDVLMSADLWGETACGRQDCLPCGLQAGNWEPSDGPEPPEPLPPSPRQTDGLMLEPSKNIKCWTESILYKLECLPCARVGTLAWYIGETSRSAFERGDEHVRNALNASDESAIAKHGWDYHGLQDNEVPLFTMMIIRSFRGALQ